MKQRNSYGLWRDRQGLSWAEVKPLGEGRWSLLASGRLEGPEPSLAGGTRVLGLMPGSLVQLGHPQLPRLRGREMERALAVWAAREGDARLDDVALAWRPMGSQDGSGGGTSSVLLAHCRQSKVAEFQEALAASGVDAETLLPDYLIFDLLLRSAENGVGEESAWSFIHLAEEESFVGIATREGPILHRSLPNSARGEVMSAHVERLSTEILRSVHRARQSKANLSIDTFFLEGDEILGEALAAKLGESQTAQIRSWSPSELLEDGGEGLEPQAIMPVAAAIAASLGLGGMNLIPRKRKGLLSPKTLKRIASVAAILMGVLVPLAVLGGLAAERRAGDRLERLNAALEEAGPLLEEAERTGLLWRTAQERERVTAAHDLGAVGLELVLADLALRTPESIRLETLRVVEREGRRILQISGVSADDFNERAQQSFLAFTSSLEESELLLRGDLPSRISIEELDPSFLEEDFEEEDEFEVSDPESEEAMPSVKPARKRVVFSLEYEIALGGGAKGGV